MESLKQTNLHRPNVKSASTRRCLNSKTAIKLSNITADESWEEFHVELALVFHWLKNRLKGKEVRFARILKEATKKRITRATLRRAFLLLGGLSRKANKKNGQWYWRLPASSPPAM